MAHTRWLLPFPLAIALVFGGCARRAWSGVHIIGANELSRANAQRLFDALHVRCWHVDLPAVTGKQYLVVKIDVRENGKGGVSHASRLFGNDRSVVVAMSGEPPNQTWFILTSAGHSSFTAQQEPPTASTPTVSSTFFDRGAPQSDGSVRLARWDYRDNQGKPIKTLEAVVTVEKRVGEGLGQVVR